MAKQTFTTGSVLTAAQMNNLQANDYNWSVDSKSASYILAATDAGKRIEMNAAGSTTITVNTGLFAAGDMVYISNIGAGTCTITAGTATVNKSTNASLALAQYQSGMLYFVSASSSIFYPFDIGSAGGTKNFSLLGTGTLTGAGAATVTVSGITNQDQLLIVIDAASSASASSIIGIRFNTDTGANYDYYSANYQVAATYDVNSMTSFGAAGSTYVPLGRMSANAGSAVSGMVMLNGCSTAGKKVGHSMASGNPSSSSGQYAYWNGIVYNSASTISSVSLFSNTGNFDAGQFLVYGSA